VRYAADAVWSASQWEGINLRVLTEEKLIDGQFMLAVVSNIRLYAGGLATLSPQSLLDDGLMELWLFDGKNLKDILQQAWSLWSGKHVKSDRVQCIPFKKINLESDSPIFIQMDGEPEDGGEQVTVEVLPRALRVMIPDRSSQSLFQNTIN